MFGIGTTELLIIAAIFVLLFGASRLPSLMRNMGRSVNEFKQGLRDEPSSSNREEESDTSGEKDERKKLK